jgi:hypothetical protein
MDVDADAEAEAQQQEQINPHRCHICPLTQDMAPRIPLENSPWMYLQCGHRIHTNCFLEKSYNDDLSTIRFSCPACQEHALTNHMVEWIEANDIHFYRPLRLETLWNENAELREDIKNLSKLQRKHSLVIRNHKLESAQLKNEWKRAIHSSLEYIRLQKKEFKNRLVNLPYRKKAIRAINEITHLRASLIAKYPNLSWHNLSQISRIPGAPNLKTYPRVGRWIFSGNRLFHIRF